MGYTHYYTRSKSNKGTAEMYGRLALDALAIIAEAGRRGIVIRDGHGRGKPEFNEAYFCINGDKETATDIAHEGFIWEANPEQKEWQLEYLTASGGNTDEITEFCKTRQKPYDAVVTAILIRAKVIYGDLVEVSSDGFWGEWSEGRDLYRAVFGEEAPNPFPSLVF